MAGGRCRAGTEAMVGLSNPSDNSEGFRIRFPGAAASGPRPSRPAFPSPGSLLWGVTFCSILAVPGSAPFLAAASPGGLGSPLPQSGRALHNPAGGAALPDGRAPVHGPLRCTWGRPQRHGALLRRRPVRKWRRPGVRANELGVGAGASSDPATEPGFLPLPTKYDLLLLVPVPHFRPGIIEVTRSRFWSRMAADRHRGSRLERRRLHL